MSSTVSVAAKAGTDADAMLTQVSIADTAKRGAIAIQLWPGHKRLTRRGGGRMVSRKDKVEMGDPEKMELPAKNERTRRRVWWGLLLWLGLVAGLLVQVFAPHLKIQNNKFVIPSSLLSEGEEVHPDEIVARERRMQVLSGILTLSSALGLGFYYRHGLFPKSTSIGE